MNQADINTKGRTGQVSALAVTSTVLAILSFCLWTVTPTMVLLRWGDRILIATLCYTPVILVSIAFVLAIAAVVKIKRSKKRLRGYELAISIIVFASVGIFHSLLVAYGYICLERTGNTVASGSVVSSPDNHYTACSNVGYVQDFWGDYKDYYTFEIYKGGSIRPNYLIAIDRMEPFDKKCFFPNGLGRGVGRGGDRGPDEDWKTTWSSDSSVVTFAFQNIELKLKVRNDDKSQNDQKQ